MFRRVLLTLALLLLGGTGSGSLSAQVGTPLTVEAVAADQRLWPREVVTKTAIPTVAGGRPLTVPAGEILRVVRVEREGVVVQFQGQQVRLPAAQTDLLAGAHGRRMQQGSDVAAPPVPGTPASRKANSAPTANPAGRPPEGAYPVYPTPTPKNLGAPQPVPLTPKAQADRAIRNVIAKEGLWILGMLGVAIAIAIAGKRFIDR